jgi:tetratricopeptide (TPR) repeat protein
MSYIHEALKKAQKQKEARYHEYQSIVSTPGYKLRFFSGKALGLTSFLLVSLAFGAYLWLPSKEASAPVTELARSAPTPVPENAVNPKALYERARSLQRRGQLIEAKQLYHKTLSADPDYVQALNNLGVIQIKEGNYSAARTSFEKAIRLKADYVDAHYNLACLNAIGGNLSQSLVHLKRAVVLNPSARNWARRDTDLGNLRGVPGFEEIVEDYNLSQK